MSHLWHTVYDMSISFDNSYSRLPDQFFTRMLPVPVSEPNLIRVNEDLCRSLNIDVDWIRSPDGVGFIAGNSIPEGAEPIATVYAGHQFGSFNPQLGDGRAILMGEVVDKQGQRFDIQLKGSGPTPYSRGGDGRAPIGPILREYIVSEAMHALGVPTSRSLAAVTSGDTVFRDEPLPGGIIARIAQSHIRIGSFQFFAAKQDIDSLRSLAEHVITRHYEATLEDHNPVEAMFKLFTQRAASLVAHWQSLGFIHGVMNTDNILLSGETIDYGPCAFIDEFHPNKVFSSIDVGGRYAYGNQPGIMQWNLTAFGQAILPLLDENQEKAVTSARAILDSFPALYQSAYLEHMSKKLGIIETRPGDDILIQDLLNIMAEDADDFTLTFRYLVTVIDQDHAGISGVPRDFQLSEAYAPWLERWQERIDTKTVKTGKLRAVMNSANPLFIPRNHLIEEAIVAATEQQDFEPFNTLVDILDRPFEFNPDFEDHALSPRPEQIVMRTFCGT